jgi:hypothetical protein
MSAPGYTCVCKRTFAAQNHFSQHQRSCSQTKKRLSSAISSFKEFLSSRKKPRNSNNEAGLAGVARPLNRLSNSPANCLASGEASTTSQHPEVTVTPLPNPSLASVGGIAPDCEGSIFRTPPNVFGLVHQYFSSKPPPHDPEEYVTIADLSLIPGAPHVNEELCVPTASSSDSRYHPYPN